MTEPANTISPETVRNRFFIIQFARLVGVAILLLGLVIWHGKGGNMLIGLPLTLIGFITTSLLPQILARRWRSPRS